MTMFWWGTHSAASTDDNFDNKRRPARQCTGDWRHPHTSKSNQKQGPVFDEHNDLKGRRDRQMMLYSGFPHIFENYFPYFFNTFSLPNWKSFIPLLTSFFNNFTHGTQCRTIINVIEQYLNKHMAQFRISILFAFRPTPNSILFQYFQYRVGTLFIVRELIGLLSWSRDTTTAESPHAWVIEWALGKVSTACS